MSDYSADTPENRVREITIRYEVPHHPIVTWQDWLLAIDAMHAEERRLMQSIETGVTKRQIEAFRREQVLREKREREAARLRAELHELEQAAHRAQT
jgi:hypothetical protein